MIDHGDDEELQNAIVADTKEEYEKGWTPSFGYYDISEGCIFFENQEQATEYLEKIKLK